MSHKIGPVGSSCDTPALFGLDGPPQARRGRTCFGALALLFSALLALSACGSCQDPGGHVPDDDDEDDPIEEEEWSGLCVEDSDCRLGQVCSSGVCQSYVDPGGKSTACVSDEQCLPTERCSTWSGVCMTLADTQPPPDRPGAVCIDGDRRTCGESKVGLCRLGYQECLEGQWDETCVGVRNPSPETCDGRDNDCDGIIDNAEEAGAWCHDGDPCRLPSRCEDGRCVLGRMKDCGGLDDACRAGVCDPATGECEAEFFADGVACDDGNLCTAGSTCADGTCETGDPIDCSSLDSECMVGQCNPVNGRCIAVAKMDGTHCSDGNLCTYATTCSGGVCGGGAPLDCSALSDECNAGICDPAFGACVAAPTRNGQSCDDGYYCSVSTVCSNGTCGGGMQRSCSASGNQCNAGVCDEDLRACVSQPANEGDTCDDGLFCTVGNVCAAGQCVGTNRACPGDVCNDGLCQEASRRCILDPVEDATPCDDGNACTLDSACQAGLCGGATPVDCSVGTDECNLGVCDPNNGQCTTVPRREGQSCDDGLFCTVGTVCQAGSCGGGGVRTCTGTGDQCNAGVCDPSQGESGACVPVPFDDGRSCQDGLYCTVNTTCQSDGTCGGGEERNCSGEGGSCRAGVCDEALGACTGEPVPDGTACEDGLFCTVAAQCQDGECLGAPRDCSGLDDQCNQGVCDEAGGRCLAQPANEGAGCEDGLFCTVNSSCSTGACTGGPRDCSASTDQCNTGICNESTRACIPDPVADNTTCNDAIWCTVNDACTGGICAGQPRNCSTADDQCNLGVCHEGTQQCLPQPSNEGAGCNDGNWCSVDEVCLSGTCAGQPRDCSGSANECNAGVCDPVARRCVSEPANEGALCDDGLFCTVSTTCSAGACLGSQRSCAGAGDQCNTGVCDETSAACVPTPVADNTICNDDQWCTVNDRCIGGSCTGVARNCSALSDECNDGVCSEAAEACVPQPKSDGTGCDDGLFCSVNEICVGGACVGSSRDCSAAGDQCNLGVCNEASRSCLTQPVANLTPCSDGLFCSVDEKCYDGQCLGVDRDCGFVTGGDPCYDSFCDEANGQCVALDNGTCFNEPPIVSCGVSDTEPWPLETITLTGSASDPDGDPLTFSWAVVTRPNGSTSQPANPSSATTTFFVDLAGQYTFELTVSDGEDTATCMVSIVVVPPQDLHVELVWDEDSGDLDLHVTKHDQSPMGAFFDISTQQRDCWWHTCTNGVGWGASLDIDAVAGFGPENINIDQDPVIGRYHIGVHNYCDVSIMPGGGLSTSKPLNARVRVYCNGQLAAELPVPGGRRALEQHGDFWLAGYVDWTGTGALGCVVTPVDDTSKPAASYLAALGYQRDQHCRMNTPCTAHSQCRPYERCMCLAANCKEIRCVLNPTCTENSTCTSLGYTGGCDTNIGLCIR